MNQEELMKLRNWRYIQPNEAVIEFDSKPEWDVYQESWNAINQTGCNLYVAGYSFEVWNHEGKCCHLHLKDFPESLSEGYKKNLIMKYVPEQYIFAVDFSLCKESKPIIAEENKPHWKTGKVKRLLGRWNENKQNFIEPRLWPEEKNERKYITGTGITAEISRKLSIISLAKEYGIEVDSRGFAICPFHPDKNPSLKFYDSQGRFCCFGCKAKGNIIVFNALMRRKNGRAD